MISFVMNVHKQTELQKNPDISWEMSQILRKLRLFNYTLNFKGQISSKNLRTICFSFEI